MSNKQRLHKKFSMDEAWQSAGLSDGNTAYIESQYRRYLEVPENVSASLRELFDRLSNEAARPESLDFDRAPQMMRRALLAQRQPVLAYDTMALSKQARVERLIQAYRQHGHEYAAINPLGRADGERPLVLTLEFHKLEEQDLAASFGSDGLYNSGSDMRLEEIIDFLQQAYCGPIGAEFMHITALEERQWLQRRIENLPARARLGHGKLEQTDAGEAQAKKNLLRRLTATEGLERHLASRYPGVKRFGIEGAESLILVLDVAAERSLKSGVQEMVIGMAHRGRLNVLVNLMGKIPKELFAEFEGRDEFSGSGDVKYHQGFSSNLEIDGNQMHIALSFNPSHLEIVSAVVMGSVRARQDRRTDSRYDQAIPVLVHGDAAFAGQGVVMETLQMSQTRAFHIGGAVHIVVNNQVGFTTSRREDARSTRYCTDVAKMIEAPILHVNGDSPEAVCYVAHLAFEYRQVFRKDIVLDLVCYRRHGHNEADEPSITQPNMYRKIRALPTVRQLYSQRLQADGVIDAGEAQDMEDGYREALERDQVIAPHTKGKTDRSMLFDWSSHLGGVWDEPVDTSVPLDELKRLCEIVSMVPEGFVLQRQVARLMADRAAMGHGDVPLNWGMAEMLAYASLLSTGCSVRISGQDVGRGTFSHRHAVLHDQETSRNYVSLQRVDSDWANFAIYDSLLSEMGVLGFEYGYAATNPEVLVIWEAQFGDFSNNAQPVFDQFISSGENKWGRLCGLVTLLPHGYEGQGPEHSSARLERYMQLCAEENLQICQPTTAAQMFHLLRRQALRKMRKPLIVLTPKSLLRSKAASSSLEELASGGFYNLLENRGEAAAEKIHRVVVCTGKIYYDLEAMRLERRCEDIALLRLEQLYPFPYQEMESVLQSYPNAQTLIWCQEEPRNQGAWHSGRHRLMRVVQRCHPKLSIVYAGRDPSAAPAVGHAALHAKQQRELVLDALGIQDTPETAQ